MSGPLARSGPLLLAGVAVGGAAYLFSSRRPPQPEGTATKSSGTTAMQNVENAYSNAGATKVGSPVVNKTPTDAGPMRCGCKPPTHTPAYGGTPMGNSSNDNLREDSPSGSGNPKGVKGGAFGDDQRASEKTYAEKKLNKSIFGDEKGK